MAFMLPRWPEPVPRDPEDVGCGCLMGFVVGVLATCAFYWLLHHVSIH